MQLGKRIIPYPIINSLNNNNSYKNASYSLEFEDYEDPNNFVLKNAKINTNSEELKNMLKENILNAVVVIDCSRTIFKRIENISTDSKDIVIPLSNLKGRVEISSFVYANKSINNYSSDDFLEDYEGYSFNIEKYSFFAVDDGFTVKVEYDDSEDKKVSSIFSIIKSYNESLKCMEVYPEERKIKIVLPKKEFNYYAGLKTREIFSNIFFSIILIPALVDCLKDLQKEEKSIESIVEQYSWFNSIKRAYKKLYSVEIDDVAFKQLNALTFSQEAINFCLISSIDDFVKIINRKNENMEDE
jgi:hypothetical protein